MTETRGRLPRYFAALVALAMAPVVAGWPARGDDANPASKKAVAKPRAKAAKDLTDAEAESIALAFVRENHPELEALLAQLKPMKPADYGRAVRELAQTSRSLAEIKQNNPRRYEAGLAVWKARSRVDLIAARLASSPDDSDGEDRLRQAVEALVDAEARQQRSEKELIEERLRKLEKNLRDLESRRDAVVENRVQALLKRSQRARRDAGASASKPQRSTKNEKGKGGRQP